MGIPTNFISIIILCNKAFKHGYAAKFLIYLGQTLNYSVWNYIILFSAIYL
jgi:hypothetical protein